MGFMDELKKLARPYSEEEDDFDDDFDVEERVPRASRASTAPRMNARSNPFDDFGDDFLAVDDCHLTLSIAETSE